MYLKNFSNLNLGNFQVFFPQKNNNLLLIFFSIQDLINKEESRLFYNLITFKKVS